MSPETFNKWRVVPRFLVFGYGFIMYDVSQWFMSVPEPNMQQTAFISTLVGAAALVFNFYVNSGK